MVKLIRFSLQQKLFIKLTQGNFLRKKQTKQLGLERFQWHSTLINFTRLETVPEQYCKAIILQLEEKKKKTVPRAAKPPSPSLLYCLVIAYCYSLTPYYQIQT